MKRVYHPEPLSSSRPRNNEIERNEQIAELQDRVERARNKNDIIGECIGLALWRNKDKNMPGFGVFLHTPVAITYRLINRFLKKAQEELDTIQNYHQSTDVPANEDRAHKVDEVTKIVSLIESELVRLSRLFLEHQNNMTALATRHPENKDLRGRLQDVQWSAWELNRRIAGVLYTHLTQHRATAKNNARRQQLENVSKQCADHLKKSTTILPKTVDEPWLIPLENNERVLRVMVSAAEAL